ncbi:hypothetical protein [Glaciecola sp. 1036]|uniref:hypothetical protein n=1 Tax=Alteromonadaceae TaxID=72275 RepID=UPI003D01BB3C
MEDDISGLCKKYNLSKECEDEILWLFDNSRPELFDYMAPRAFASNVCMAAKTFLSLYGNVGSKTEKTYKAITDKLDFGKGITPRPIGKNDDSIESIIVKFFDSKPLLNVSEATKKEAYLFQFYVFLYYREIRKAKEAEKAKEKKEAKETKESDSSSNLNTIDTKDANTRLKNLFTCYNKILRTSSRTLSQNIRNKNYKSLLFNLETKQNKDVDCLEHAIRVFIKQGATKAQIRTNVQGEPKKQHDEPEQSESEVEDMEEGNGLTKTSTSVTNINASVLPKYQPPPEETESAIDNSVLQPKPRDLNNVNFLNYRKKSVDALNLPYISYHLTLKERTDIWREVEKDLKALSGKNSGVNLDSTGQSAFVVALMITTASTFEQILSFQLKNQFCDNTYSSIQLTPIGWLRKSLSLVNAIYSGSNAQRNKWLHPHSEYLTLPMPTSVSHLVQQLLRSSIKCNNCLLERFVNINREDLNKYLLGLKERLGLSIRRLTEKNLRYLLFSTMAERLGEPTPSDIDIASLIFATDEFSNPMSLYYLSISSAEASSHYALSLKRLSIVYTDIEHRSSAHIGSRLCINIDMLSHSIQKLANKIEQLVTTTKMQVDEAIELHNSFACYVSLSLMAITGHRNNEQLFFDEITLDEKLNYCLVSDKYSEQYSAMRFSGLPKTIQTLLQNYRKQMRFVLFMLNRKYPECFISLFDMYKGRSTNKPLLSQIKGGSLEPITITDICKSLGNDFDLPHNFARHLLSSNLTPNQLPYRRQLLGHVEQGQHMLDDFAMANGLSVLEELSNANESYLKTLGLRPIEGRYTQGVNFKEMTYHLNTEPTNAFYSPAMWLERETNRTTVMKFILEQIKTVPDLYASRDDRLEQIFSELKVRKTPDDWPTRHIKLYGILLDNIQGYFKETDDVRLRKKMLRAGGAKHSGHLHSLYCAKTIEILQKQFLEFLAVGNEQDVERSDEFEYTHETIYLSLILFQPAVIEQERRHLPAKLAIYKYRDTFYIQAQEGNKTVYPLNLMSSYLLLNSVSNHSQKEYEGPSVDIPPQFLILNKKHMAKVFNQFKHHVVPYLNEQQVERALLHVNRLKMFMCRNAIFQNSRIGFVNSVAKFKSSHYAFCDLIKLTQLAPRLILKTEPKEQSSKDKNIVSNLIKVPQSVGNIDVYDKLKETIEKSAYGNRSNILACWAEIIGVTQSDDITWLIKNSQQLSHLSLALLAFMHEASGRQSRKNPKNKILSTSLVEYLTTVYKTLGPVVKDSQFLFYDEEEFSHLYFDAVKNLTRKVDDVLLSRLRDFNDTTARFLNPPNVDLSHVWQLFNSNRRFKSSNLSNIVTEQNYQDALHAIDEVSVFSDDDKLVHKASLIFCQRAGLRPMDLKLIHHKQLDTKNWILAVQGRKYLPSKSVNTPRRIPLSLYLNDYEKEILTNLVDHINRLYTPKDNRDFSFLSYFMGASIEHIQYVFEIVTNNLGNILKHVSNNPSVRLYDCRHSFVNFHVLFLGNAHQDTRYKKVMQEWCRNDDLESFRAELLRSLISQQSEVGGIAFRALAQRMGHSPITCREYYLHALNIISEMDSNNGVKRLTRHTRFIKQITAQQNKIKGTPNRQFRLEVHVRTKIRGMPNVLPNDVIQCSDIKVALPELYSLVSYPKAVEIQCLHLHTTLLERFETQRNNLPNNVPNVLQKQIDKLKAYVKAINSSHIFADIDNVNDADCLSFQRTFAYLGSPIFIAVFNNAIRLLAETPEQLLYVIQFWKVHANNTTLWIKELELARFKEVCQYLGLNVTLMAVSSNSALNRYHVYFINDKRKKSKSINLKINYLFGLLDAVLSGSELSK